MWLNVCGSEGKGSWILALGLVLDLGQVSQTPISLTLKMKETKQLNIFSSSLSSSVI